MTELRSLAHPEWPYTGTPHEWRGFAKDRRFVVPAGFRLADPVKAEAELRKPDGVIEVIYQKLNFGPELD